MEITEYIAGLRTSDIDTLKDHRGDFKIWDNYPILLYDNSNLDKIREEFEKGHHFRDFWTPSGRVYERGAVGLTSDNNYGGPVTIRFQQSQYIMYRGFILSDGNEHQAFMMIYHYARNGATFTSEQEASFEDPFRRIAKTLADLLEYLVDNEMSFGLPEVGLVVEPK